jgi:hypothetical protein
MVHGSAAGPEAAFAYRCGAFGKHFQRCRRKDGAGKIEEVAMKKTVLLVIVLISVMFTLPAFAEKGEEKKEPYPYPWSKFHMDLGVYFASLDSGVTLGGSKGLGLKLDVEDLLGLETTDVSFRLAAGYRIGKKRRHKLELSWFRFHREGENEILQAIEIPEEIGGGGTIGPGTIESVFNFDIYKFKYEYSFILDERSDLNVGIGLFIMPIEFGVGFNAPGIEGIETEESITAPLPVVGLGFDFAITPKWIIRQQLEFFYLEYDNFEGQITSLAVSLEYFPWKHVGFGLGAEGLDVGLKVSGETDYPGLGDFIGTLDFSYIGAQLYLKLVF